MNTKPQDLTRTTLAVLFICALIAASFWVLWPLMTAIVWALVIVIPSRFRRRGFRPVKDGSQTRATMSENGLLTADLMQDAIQGGKS